MAAKASFGSTTPALTAGIGGRMLRRALAVEVEVAWQPTPRLRQCHDGGLDAAVNPRLAFARKH
jgi:hypothetical protein